MKKTRKPLSQKVIVLLIVLVLYAFFCIMSENFRKYTTFLSILDYSYYIVLMAIGVAFPLITGGVDLSIGTGLICYSLAGGYLVVHCGWPTWAGLLITVAFGIAIGIVNGLLVAIMDLPPFLATLCTCMITRGLGSICSKNYGISWPVAGSPGSEFRSFFKLTVPLDGETWYQTLLKVFFEGKKVKLPVGFLWVLIVVIIMSFVLNHTKVGRYTIAIGSNKEAARLSGINVKFYHVVAYAISGLFAGLAAVAYSAIFATVQPGTGAGFELEAIGGAIMGGVSATGGAGSIWGPLLGVYVICLLKTGLPFVGLQANWQQIITGLVLIGAVLVDLLKNKKIK